MTAGIGAAQDGGAGHGHVLRPYGRSEGGAGQGRRQRRPRHHAADRGRAGDDDRPLRRSGGSHRRADVNLLQAGRRRRVPNNRFALPVAGAHSSCRGADEVHVLIERRAHLRNEAFRRARLEPILPPDAQDAQRARRALQPRLDPAHQTRRRTGSAARSSPSAACAPARKPPTGSRSRTGARRACGPT